MLVFLIVALLWAVAWLTQDALKTDKGIKAGVAFEGNAIVRALSGTSKPSFAQIMAIEVGVIRVPLFGAGAAALVSSATLPIAFLMGVALVIAGVKNIQGARKWQWMFDHPGQKLPVMTTVWTKLIGFWG